MKTPPPEIIKAAHLITEWAANNNLQEFAILGIQHRVKMERAVYGCGGDPLDDDLADDWCNDYHCAGDCGLKGHGYQHEGN
jgi:predicted ATP-grasp superfamily ATP-dependent carboligase